MWSQSGLRLEQVSQLGRSSCRDCSVLQRSRLAGILAVETAATGNRPQPKKCLRLGITTDKAYICTPNKKIEQTTLIHEDISVVFAFTPSFAGV